MIKKLIKIRLFNKVFHINVLFLFSLFVLWGIIGFYEKPVDVRDEITTLNLKYNDIKVSKNNGLEYAHFNNCKSEDNCSCRVIVHGIGDNFQNWSQILKGVKKDNIEGQWIAFNYPGTGNSDPFPNKEAFRVNEFAQTVNSRITQLCKGPIDVIAGSMGTWISFWWVIQYPENINSLVLLNPVGAYADYTYLADAMVNPTVDKLKDLHRRAYHNMSWYPDQIYKNTLRNIVKRGNRQFILSQDRTLAIDKYLPGIKQKTFIIWGKSDQILPINTYYTYLDKMPNVQGEIFEDCGHVPNSECPEKVLSVIKKFYN